MESDQDDTVLLKLMEWEKNGGLASLSTLQIEAISDLTELASEHPEEPSKESKSKETDASVGVDSLQTASQLASLWKVIEEDILNEAESEFQLAETEIEHWEKEISTVAFLMTSVLSQLDNLELQYDSINEKTDTLRSTCMEMIKKKNDYLEAPNYLARYNQCQSIALNQVRKYVRTSLESSTAQALNYLSRFDAEEVTRATSSSNAYAALYGKVRGPAAKIKKVVGYIEPSISSVAAHELALADCQESYINQRKALTKPSIAGSVQDILSMKDTCALLRAGCALMMRVVQDEYDLYFAFFTLKCSEFENFLEDLLLAFYDGLRSRLIKVVHMETLAELCSILRSEMLTDYVVSSENLGAFVRMTVQLLADIQERLVYRAHIYVQEDILGYKPSHGDLAYPDKLVMIESIAESLQSVPATGGLRRSDSQLSMISVTSSVYDGAPKSRSGTSPADLHGMWYPPLRRALLCLSKLSRCADRNAFQGLSQEILQAVCSSIDSAAARIKSEKSQIDGMLFQIKHLLILREQIAPFQVDFTVKEINLDFSHIKDTAMNVLQKPSRMFSFSTNNVLLEFLLDGAPHVKEQLKDSRRLVERQLKANCELFINYSTFQIVGPLSDFLSKADIYLEESKEKNLSSQNWAKAEVLADIVAECQRNIGVKLPSIQRSMQLYISNKETEFILYKPIKNQIMANYLHLEQILKTSFSEEDAKIINVTPLDQLNVLLSTIPNRTHRNRT
ncbi:hypothetical protein QYM36_016296 [Artemia franciscana]|uniref:Conserved oligomeric Golgi complex subunit 3 C-terminal domain-containing protein n=1 Tax=Artemia franciscana TaxID=6661 RepID=A0AA88KY08_ARTSF|nr:hypothetical protein QYM36_016296 [Artemia franciscana]